VETLKKKVRIKRSQTSGALVNEELSPWILNTDYSESRGSKYSKMLILCWNVKEFVSCAIESKGNKKLDIIQRFDQLNNKNENLINAIWGSKVGNDDTQDV
jgi:hypothetical protein